MTAARLVRAALRLPAPSGISFWSGLLVISLAHGSAFAAPAKPESPAGAGAAPIAPDFSEYQRLLDEFLSVVSAPNTSIETRIDYMRLYAEPDRKERFARIREQLFQIAPSSMDARSRLAWAINAYNYLAIETATNHLFESRGRKPQGDKMYSYGVRIAHVMTITLPGGDFFTAPLVEIEGEKYSLNTFERHFVFADYDHKSGKPAPPKLDPRPHFALVCASKGCPALMPRAYRADSIERQLDFAVRNALASPRHLFLFQYTGQLLVSSIFDWYQADFGGPEGVVGFVRKYSPAAMRKEMEQRKVQRFGVFIKWEWGLNDLETRADEGSVNKSG